MFKYDSKGTLYYLSANNKEYYLVKGYSNNMLSSDIIFIYYYDEEKTIIVDFIYGDFEEDTLNYINDIIMKYEDEKGDM